MIAVAPKHIKDPKRKRGKKERGNRVYWNQMTSLTNRQNTTSKNDIIAKIGFLKIASLSMTTKKDKPLSITGRVASCTTVIFSYPASFTPFNDSGEIEHWSNLWHHISKIRYTEYKSSIM